MTTVAELLIESLADYGVTTVWGVVGDALNPVTDAIRREDRIEWIGVRHEEAGAFAASAQAQLTGDLAVCMGTVGPGAIHLLNGLYDAKKSHAPVLAICGQVPREEMGSEFFQEVDNDALFADVAVFNQTVTSIDQLPLLIEQAGNAAIQDSGVAVLTLPGDVGGLDLPKGTAVPTFVDTRPAQHARAGRGAAGRVAAQRGRQGDPAGRAGRPRRARGGARSWPSGSPRRWCSRLKAKEGLERRQPTTRSASRGCSATTRPPRRSRAATCCSWSAPTSPTGTSCRPGRRSSSSTCAARTSVVVRRSTSPLVGDAALGLQALLPLLEQKTDRDHLDDGPDELREVAASGRPQFTDPAYDHKPKGLLRRKVDNPDALIRPELLAAALDRHAAHDAVFTTDTGHGHGLALAVRADDRRPSADRLLQPRLDGQRDAAGAGRQRARPRRARWSPSAATAGSRC